MECEWTINLCISALYRSVRSDTKYRLSIDGDFIIIIIIIGNGQFMLLYFSNGENHYIQGQTLLICKLIDGRRLTD